VTDDLPKLNVVSFVRFVFVVVVFCDKRQGVVVPASTSGAAMMPRSM